MTKETQMCALLSRAYIYMGVEWRGGWGVGGGLAQLAIFCARYKKCCEKKKPDKGGWECPRPRLLIC